MKKLPYGISNYEEIIEDGYYFVDKTKYIEELEKLPEKRIMFLRPRKFGKTLFTSVIENYYDITKKNKFEKLFGETYIGKNPTQNRNSYNILRFNFSGINTDTRENTISGFKNRTIESIKIFIGKYNLDFYINENQEAEEILNSLFTAFILQKQGEKIYVIIDEYDHFANELLSFSTDNFKSLVSKNGKVRKWYEILKQGTETIIDRIFITGVAPITLDSLTSGFNICSDKTKDRTFNEMLGFTRQELEDLLDEQEITCNKQEVILPIMEENYDGYKFSSKADEKIYNSNMCLYFLKEYVKYKEIPEQLVDMNIARDYSKLANLLKICQSERKIDIIEKTVSGEGLSSELVGTFNPEIGFGEKELISMLYYLGYLTIKEEEFGFTKFIVPNKVIKELYSEYFMDSLNKETDLNIHTDYSEIAKEIALNGEITKIIELFKNYLNNLSNRDFQKFDEKYMKLIFYTIAMNLKIYNVKSEMEINRKYPDILLLPRNKNKEYNSIMIEFKYLRKDQFSQLKKVQEIAKQQIKEYSSFQEIKDIVKLKMYTVVTVVDDVYVEEVQ